MVHKSKVFLMLKWILSWSQSGPKLLSQQVITSAITNGLWCSQQSSIYMHGFTLHIYMYTDHLIPENFGHESRLKNTSSGSSRLTAKFLHVRSHCGSRCSSLLADWVIAYEWCRASAISSGLCTAQLDCFSNRKEHGAISIFGWCVVSGISSRAVKPVKVIWLQGPRSSGRRYMN